MSWAVKLTTDVGTLELPLSGYYKTKREAEEVANKAKQIPGTIAAEVLKKQAKPRN